MKRRDKCRDTDKLSCVGYAESERTAEQKADEILREYADMKLLAYAEEADRLISESKGRERSLRRRLLRCAAVFVCVVFAASLALPIPQASAWRIWWMDLVTGENKADLDMYAEREFIEYYVSEPPQGFELTIEKIASTRYTAHYENKVGEYINFTQTPKPTTGTDTDNEKTGYRKQLIADFEVMVGENSRETVFEISTDNAALFIRTNASYAVGEEFIKKLEKN